MSHTLLCALERPLVATADAQDWEILSIFGDLPYELERRLYALPESGESVELSLSVEEADILVEAARVLEILVEVTGA